MTGEFPPSTDATLSPETQSALDDVLDGFFEPPLEKAEQFDWDEFRRNETFKAAMMDSPLFWVIGKFERSFTQRLGEQLYEKAACAIADSNDDYGDAQTGYTVDDLSIYPAQEDAIETICTALSSDTRDPDWVAERDTVLSAPTTGSTKDAGRITWDVWVEEYLDTRPLALEIKSPKPNTDQAVEAKRKMLRTLAAYTNSDEKPPVVRFAFPFNPYGSREDYNHWPTLNVFDVSDSPALWIADDLWDTLGGPGTMDALLNYIVDNSEGNREKLVDLAGDRTL